MHVSSRRGFSVVAGLLALAMLACSVLTGSPANDAEPTRGPVNPTAENRGPTVIPPTAAATRLPAGPITPVTDHPRLWLTAADLPRLRSWASPSNPLYAEALAPLAAEARAAMDDGTVPASDGGSDSWEEYPTEQYAQLFAFMSLVSPDQAERDDFGRRARTLLMYVMGEAAKGPADDRPFRDPGFASSDSDRSRWWGEGFALTVDWAYPYFTAEDKAVIRQVFLRWSDELVNASYQGPDPIGVLNDPSMLADRFEVRWSGNNYFTAHMRNLGLMALALDPADDPDGELGDYLDNAIGAWLYLVDELMRTDAAGGLGPEGFEYSPQAMGYVVQFLLALHTAGQDDPARWGKHVVLTSNPWWDEMLPAYLHSLSPATAAGDEVGEHYQPAWYGDGESYWNPDFIETFGPLGLYDMATGNATRLDAARWIEMHTPPGGRAGFLDRASSPASFHDTLLLFMLFDPQASPPVDPRPALALDLYVPGMGRLLSRTDWTSQAAWFTYLLAWNTIDHQQANGNQFEFYRDGEWLTKERTSYSIPFSDYHNTLGLENDEPEHNEPGEYRNYAYLRGSQWLYDPSGDGHILAYSFNPSYLSVTGDATDLYNSAYEGVEDIVEASRTIVWLKPDHIVIFDRAESRTAGRFKRFWLNLPAPAEIAGQQSAMSTDSGQQMFVTTLLPADALIESQPAEALEELNGPANNEPMRYRLLVEAPGGPARTRFLHVLQGADAGAAPDRVTLIESSGGTPYVGALIGTSAVLFAVDLGAPPESVSFSVPTGTRVYISGLAPSQQYDLQMSAAGDQVAVTLRPGGSLPADTGGLLVFDAAP